MQTHTQSAARRVLEAVPTGLTRLGVGYALMGLAIVALLSR
jgi:hypothetical protein